MADTIIRETTSTPTEQPEVHAGIIMPTMSREERRIQLRALLNELMADESGYDQEVWPELKAALDRDRLSDRKLFDE